MQPTNLKQSRICRELSKSLESGVDKESCYAMIEFKFDFGAITEDDALIAMYLLDSL